MPALALHRFSLRLKHVFNRRSRARAGAWCGRGGPGVQEARVRARNAHSPVPGSRRRGAALARAAASTEASVLVLGTLGLITTGQPAMGPCGEGSGARRAALGRIVSL